MSRSQCPILVSTIVLKQRSLQTGPLPRLAVSRFPRECRPLQHLVCSLAVPPPGIKARGSPTRTWTK
ncbi:hypothetical protein TIFTF001_021792 [Ficus carica]|uniref:Uncharacterized protein n=1 Tax=Ficus carica TaxID=3494 RepID=A0AA88AL01_FICCA|nr:hypothetical protein TIFTF001_021792 [Ficus carica]